jgi:hypothetical protein
LRSAIRAGDEDIVAIILETTKSNINKIDLNSTVYKFNGEQQSPLGLAAGMCHLGLVRMLLKFGAKVDVGSLNAVVSSWPRLSDGNWREKENERRQLVGIFLANGASADCETLETILEEGLATGSTLDLLIRTVFGESHWELLETTERNHSDFATIMKEHAWAETLFFDLLKTCQSMDCSETCKSTYFGTFDRILISVITNGNLELTRSL